MKKENAVLEVNGATERFETMLYPYVDRKTGEMFYSLNNYSYEEMVLLDVDGGLVADAQIAHDWAEEFNRNVNATLDLIGEGEELFSKIHVLQKIMFTMVGFERTSLPDNSYDPLVLNNEEKIWKRTRWFSEKDKEMLQVKDQKQLYEKLIELWNGDFGEHLQESVSTLAECRLGVINFNKILNYSLKDEDEDSYIMKRRMYSFFCNCGEKYCMMCGAIEHCEQEIENEIIRRFHQY